MFLRVKHNKVYIIESYRDKKGVSKHKYLGSLPVNKDVTQMEKVAKALLRLAKSKSCILDNSALEVSRKVYGVPLLIDKVWNYLELKELLDKLSHKHRHLGFDLERVVFFLVTSRFCWPTSKLATYGKRHRLYGEFDMELHDIYRALDMLADSKESIELELFKMRKRQELDVVFFDTTSLYFDSQDNVGVRQKGYSKDGKFADVQVIIAILVDKEATPIAFELFPGNTTDIKTLKSMLVKLAEKFKLRRIVIVGDSGVMGEENLSEIERLGYNFILAARIGNLSKSKKEEISDHSKYSIISETEEEMLKLYETSYNGRKLLVTWSSKRARKDKREREEVIRKLELQIQKGKKGVIANQYRKYVGLEGKHVSIRPEICEADEKLDGICGITTNVEGMSIEDILGHYRNLWKIEETFRLMKSQFEVRPIFHWTDRRILGHLVLCFLVLYVARYIEKGIKGRNVSLEKVIEALMEVEIGEIEADGNRYHVRSAVGSLAEEIFRIFKIQMPSFISHIG